MMKWSCCHQINDTGASDQNKCATAALGCDLWLRWSVADQEIGDFRGLGFFFMPSALSPILLVIFTM